MALQLTAWRPAQSECSRCIMGWATWLGAATELIVTRHNQIEFYCRLVERVSDHWQSIEDKTIIKPARIMLMNRIVLRLFLIIGIANASLYPQALSENSWGKLLDIAVGPRMQLRDYAVTRAITTIEKLESLGKEAVVPKSLRLIVELAKLQYKKDKKHFPSIWTIGDILRVFPQRDQLRTSIEELIRERLFSLRMRCSHLETFGFQLRGKISMLVQADYSIVEKEIKRNLSNAEKEELLKKTASLVSWRIEQLGISNYSVTQLKDSEMLIQANRTSAPDAIQSFIHGKESIEFSLVDEESLPLLQKHMQEEKNRLIDRNSEIIQPRFLRKGSILRGVYKKDAYGIYDLIGYTVLLDEYKLSGKFIDKAAVAKGREKKKESLIISLSSEGGDRLFEITKSNIGRSIAISIESKVIAQARITEPIRNNVSVGGFSEQERNDFLLKTKLDYSPVPIRNIRFDISTQEMSNDELKEVFRRHKDILDVFLILSE